MGIGIVGGLALLIGGAVALVRNRERRGASAMIAVCGLVLLGFSLVFVRAFNSLSSGR